MKYTMENGLSELWLPNIVWIFQEKMCVFFFVMFLCAWKGVMFERVFDDRTASHFFFLNSDCFDFFNSILPIDKRTIELHILYLNECSVLVILYELLVLECGFVCVCKCVSITYYYYIIRNHLMFACFVFGLVLFNKIVLEMF